MAGFLTAVVAVGTSASVNFGSVGLLSATAGPMLPAAASLGSEGTLDIAGIQQRQNAQLDLTGAGTLTAQVSQIYNTAAALSGSGAVSATAVNPFTPFTDIDVNYTNQPTPAGTSGVYVTLYGAGANGNSGPGSNTNASGGSGGRGGSKVGRSFIDVSLLGPTYSVTKGASNGAASTFSSGGISLSAGATATQSGITGMTLANGSSASGSNTSGAGSGGGHGANVNSNGNWSGGKTLGGNTSGGDGNTMGGDGGDGGGSSSGSANHSGPGTAGAVPGGGGGGGAATISSVGGSNGGAGGAGRTKLEWV